MDSRVTTERLLIDTIRTLSMDAVQAANSGHPGTPMALAPVAYTIYDQFLRFNPENPKWVNRDRFVLSVGHASMLLYSSLYLNGYDVSLDDLKKFRQLHAKTAGHPEYGLCPGVEATTGPLGQGVGNSVGMAIAQKWLGTYFNRPGHEIIDYQIIALASDGCMMEGISSEAASLAGHLGLGNLVWLYDNNEITIEGSTNLAFSENVAMRFASYGWEVQHVKDANNTEQIGAALFAALGQNEKPQLIIVDSHIGWGSPNRQDSAKAHGEALGEEEVKLTKKTYGWDPEKLFNVPGEALAYREQQIKHGRKREADWNEKFAAYEKAFPELAARFKQWQRGTWTLTPAMQLPSFPADAKGTATREASGKVLNAVADQMPWLIGGSADLEPSTKTFIKSSTSIRKGDFAGRNLHFGIREHVMGAVVNGLTLSGLRGYGSTFLIFSDYMRPSIRLSALMEQPAIWIFTHDSIGLGEDGPTHQPIEHLASLRAMPHLDVLRPADANEVAVLWKHALSLTNRPALFVLTRQAVPTIDRTTYASAEGALRGGYIVADTQGTPDVILISTGSELQLCLEASTQLKQQGIAARVVSLPCWELFDRQEKSYREKVLPPDVTCRVSIEAGATTGWEKYVGMAPQGIAIGINEFGASAPAKALMNAYGITVEAIIAAAKKSVKEMKTA